jgi:hypothetical protein
MQMRSNYLYHAGLLLDSPPSPPLVVPPINYNFHFISKSLIDVVYIGILHTEHLRVGKMVLDHGKHVLCEKPLCLTVRDTKELVEYARKKNLFFMEVRERNDLCWPENLSFASCDSITD